MNFLHQIERLQKLNKLIEQERTGTPEELASRLRVKERTLYEILDSIKSLGVVLKYDKKRKTYYYQEGDILQINFKLSVLKNEEIQRVFGGRVIFSRTAFFPQCTKLSLLHH
ncbi:MAG: DNA-binding protein [Ekhidna sp.]